MLMRTDPFRELDRLTQQFLGSPGTPGTWSRPTPMPLDAYRVGDEFVVAFDLPGVAPDAIERTLGRARDQQGSLLRAAPRFSLGVSVKLLICRKRGRDVAMSIMFRITYASADRRYRAIHRPTD